jgi:protein-S-isoprenylcysteine O-methyltransferase Ste14
MVIGSIRLGRNLSPFPKPRDDGALVREGIFALVRHPICSGFVFLTLGWSLVWTSLAALVGALILLAFFDIKARREERWLATTFAEYTEYRHR